MRATSRTMLAAVFILVSCGSSQGTRITPELEPVSDKKFFKKDYPNDLRPTPTNHFGYPYPKVQDSDRFDKDYVEDKNDDGGEWEAQMKYDSMKNKLRKEKMELKKAIEKEHGEEQDLEKAKAKEKDLEAKAVAAEARAKAAAEAAKKAKDIAEDAGDTANHKLGKVDGAAAKVEDEVKDLENCKKQLEDARKQLKKLLDERLEAAKKEAEAARAAADAEKAEVAAEKNEQSLEDQLAEEEKEHEKALGSVKEEMKDVAKVEEDLDTAAKNLRKFRTADAGGGITEKAGASHAGVFASAVLAAILHCLF